MEVSGILEEHDDLPVFVVKPGEPQLQGTPVAAGTNLHEAGKRYLLQGAQWRVVD